MKKSIKFLFTLLALLIAFTTISAQVNTLYYMKMAPKRSDFNPAFQPIENFYIGLPVISSIYVGAGNNSLSLHDIIYPKTINGKMTPITFFHVGENIDNFYNKLKSTTNGHNELSIDLLSFGARIDETSYFNFGVALKSSSNIFLPKDLFKLALYGTPDTINTNSFDLGRFAFNTTLYTEVALGYSKEINDRLSIGGKVKFLIGNANTSFRPNAIKLDASKERWMLNMDGQINATIPDIDNLGIIERNNMIYSLNFGGYLPDNVIDCAKMVMNLNGFGGAIDLGANYKLNDRVNLSAAVQDLGFIHWKKNSAVNFIPEKKFIYTGMNLYDNDNKMTIADWDEKYIQAMADSFRYTTTYNAYNTMLAAKVLLGGEYALIKEMLTVGLLSKSTLVNKTIFEELTTSLNFIPSDFFNASISYSWINGKFNTIGAGVSGRLGPITLYFAGDYIPFEYTTCYNIPLPHKNLAFNIQGGLMLTFGRKDWDDDNDGVKNRKDKCPYTPVGYWVDKYGCPIDTDGDGVADNVDKCPNTPKGVPVDEYGCPFDTDGDGVPDYLDKCPDTPEGVVVDEYGCPIDSDGDGVPDYLDKCPDTPIEARGFVDEFGCPLDTDGDGVPDYLDKCPDTPIEARGFVDEFGCPLDTDGDGVPDYLDKCPTVKGIKENKGCPEVAEAVKKVFEKTLQGIEFESGKDVIKKVSFPILNQIVGIMKDNPEYWLIINGHTDNVGKPEKNQLLSEKRAKSVQSYLIKGGVEESRMTIGGYGDTKPVVPNTTKANKAKNRRVEFIVKFEGFEKQ